MLSDAKYRASYIKSKLDVLIPSQIKALRGDMTQAELANQAGMLQSRISAMETPGKTNFNLDTLVRLAATFRVALVVKFVPYSEMLRWENAYSQDEFQNITHLEDDGAFLNPPSVHVVEDQWMRFGSYVQQSNVADSAITCTNIGGSFPIPPQNPQAASDYLPAVAMGG